MSSTPHLSEIPAPLTLTPEKTSSGSDPSVSAIPEDTLASHVQDTAANQQHQLGAEVNLKEIQVMRPSGGLVLPAIPQSHVSASASFGMQTAVPDPLLHFQRMQEQQAAAALQHEQAGLGSSQIGEGVKTTLAAVGQSLPNFVAMAVPGGDSPSLSTQQKILTPRIVTQTVTRIEVEPEAPLKRGRSDVARDSAVQR